jgi:hypothetical protein
MGTDVVAIDPHDPDGLWITEVWDTQKSHKASLARRGPLAAMGCLDASRAATPGSETHIPGGMQDVGSAGHRGP